MNETMDFAHILQSTNSELMYEVMRKVILSDDQLDEKTMIQKLIALVHSYNQIKVEHTG